MKILFFLLVILSLLASSCTPKVSAPSPVATTPQGSAPPNVLATVTTSKADDASWAKVVQEARKEGRVAIYSFALAGDAGEAISRAFYNKYGVKLDIVAGTSPALLERVKSEYRAKQFMTDVADMSSSRILELKDASITTSAKDIPVLKDKAGWYTHPFDLDPDGHVLSYYSTQMTPYINTTLVKPGDEPKSWLDLLQPRWKGKVMAGDPGVYAATTYLYYSMVKKTNRLSEDYFRQLGGQISKFVPGGARDQVLVLVRGEGPINITASSSGGSSLITEGAPVKAIDLKEGGMFSPSTVSAMLSKAPHPNSARLFLNWFLSAEGLRIFAEAASATTMRKDVPDFLPSTAKIDLSKAISLNFVDMDEINKLYNAGYVTKLWKGETGK